MQHKDGQALRGLAILLLSIQGLLDGDGGQCAGKLHQHRRQQRQLILAQILGDGNGKGVHRCGKSQRIKVLLCHSITPFLMKIGAPLRSGKPHDGRAPDYDDWDLNGDLLFWNDPLQCSYELSSMGIRVSPESMDKQLTMAGCDDRRALPFHKAVLAGELPYTIGGGIGQSRLCMLLLGSVHIGEVQASVWDKATREACAKAGIPLL